MHNKHNIDNKIQTSTIKLKLADTQKYSFPQTLPLTHHVACLGYALEGTQHSYICIIII
jgi:hypothetical protein